MVLCNFFICDHNIVLKKGLILKCDHKIRKTIFSYKEIVIVLKRSISNINVDLQDCKNEKEIN